MFAQEVVNAIRGVAVGEKQPDFVAGTKLDLLLCEVKLARAVEAKPGGEAQEVMACRTGLDAPFEMAIGFLDAEIDEERQEPIIGQRVVIERLGLADASGIILSWG